MPRYLNTISSPRFVLPDYRYLREPSPYNAISGHGPTVDNRTRPAHLAPSIVLPRQSLRVSCIVITVWIKVEISAYYA